jgi:transposase InsO family protein
MLLPVACPQLHSDRRRSAPFASANGTRYRHNDPFQPRSRLGMQRSLRYRTPGLSSRQGKIR